MAQLSKERLEEIHAEYSRPNHSKSFSVKDVEIAELTSELLERRERDKQEPVAVLAQRLEGYESPTFVCHLLIDEDNGEVEEGSELYAEPQPAPVAQPVQVPKEITVWTDSHCVEKRFWQKGWNACRAAMLKAEPVSQPYTLPEDTKRLDWLDAQNKRLNEYHGTSYGWKFDANFQRNAMMLNDSNYPVMNVRQAIDEAMRAAPQEPTK